MTTVHSQSPFGAAAAQSGSTSDSTTRRVRRGSQAGPTSAQTRSVTRLKRTASTQQFPDCNVLYRPVLVTMIKVPVPLARGPGHILGCPPTADDGRALSVHMDQSDVTVNAALGEEWTEGDLVFTGARNSGREKTERVQLRVPVGRAIMHVGQHWHRALNIASGQRSNAIFWLRSDVRQRSAAETFVDTCEGDRGRLVRADL